MTKALERFARGGKPCKTEGCDKPAVQGRRYCLACIRKRDKVRLQSQARKEKLEAREVKKKAARKAKRKISNEVLHSLWREVVAKRAGNKCEVCGASRPCKDNGESGHLHPHHIFGRRMFRLRFDADNGVYLCPSCHKFSSEFSAHETPMMFGRWLEQNRTPELLGRIIEIAQMRGEKLDRAAAKAALEKELGGEG